MKPECRSGKSARSREETAGIIWMSNTGCRGIPKENGRNGRGIPKSISIGNLGTI
jgi:hypothetical protein